MFQRASLDTPGWWQELDTYIAEQRTRNAAHVQSALIPVLHYIQDEFGYIPPRAMNHVAQALGVPTSYVEGVASFYSYFSLEPKGLFTIAVCMGTACYVRGGQAVLEEFSAQLGIREGETTADGLFTLQCARCLGACGQAPVVMIQDKIHATVRPEEVSEIIAVYTAQTREAVAG
jgi:NADH-quinone oxidoreductase subunit E/NADP-reducing hydrogenase subunit HndA